MTTNTARVPAFDGLTMYAMSDTAIWAMAQEQSDANGAPVAIWTRDGWMVICEEPEPEPAPEDCGWRLVALVDPSEAI